MSSITSRLSTVMGHLNPKSGMSKLLEKNPDDIVSTAILPGQVL